MAQDIEAVAKLREFLLRVGPVILGGDDNDDALGDCLGHSDTLALLSEFCQAEGPSTLYVELETVAGGSSVDSDGSSDASANVVHERGGESSANGVSVSSGRVHPSEIYRLRRMHRGGGRASARARAGTRAPRAFGGHGGLGLFAMVAALTAVWGFVGHTYTKRFR